MTVLRATLSDTRLRQFFLYVLCGGTGVLVDLSLYALLLWYHCNYQVANAIGYIAGTLTSFWLNRHFTFQMYDRTLHRLGLFFATAFTGYLVSGTILWMLVTKLDWGPLPAKLAMLLVILVLQFSLNRALTFKAAKGNPSE